MFTPGEWTTGAPFQRYQERGSRLCQSEEPVMSVRMARWACVAVARVGRQFHSPELRAFEWNRRIEQKE